MYTIVFIPSSYAIDVQTFFYYLIFFLVSNLRSYITVIIIIIAPLFILLYSHTCFSFLKRSTPNTS